MMHPHDTSQVLKKASDNLILILAHLHGHASVWNPQRQMQACYSLLASSLAMYEQLFMDHKDVDCISCPKMLIQFCRIINACLEG